MKIQKFISHSEEDAIRKAKETIGKNTVILKVEEVKMKGLFGNKKSEFIVSAVESEGSKNVGEAFMKEMLSFVKKEEPKKIEQKKEEPKKEELKKESIDFVIEEDFAHIIKDDVLSMKDKRIRELEEEIKQAKEQAEIIKNTNNSLEDAGPFDNPISLAFYEELVSHGVLPEIAKSLLDDSKEETSINTIAASVYSNILNILKTPSHIRSSMYETKFIFFFGPTGVGKTTTIAKIASKLILDENQDVALITLDTYRIAAAEQLKVYADILSCDIDVVNGKEDFEESASKFQRKGKKMVLVDTAGRSHKNSQNVDELAHIFDSSVLNEKFLVLSCTTKYEDLISIINQFTRIGNFRLILTKLDETLNYGNILNICFNLNIEIVYVTIGQNVPYDIEILKPQKIAKALLGLEVYT